MKKYGGVEVQIYIYWPMEVVSFTPWLLCYNIRTRIFTIVCVLFVGDGVK